MYIDKQLPSPSGAGHLRHSPSLSMYGRNGWSSHSIPQSSLSISKGEEELLAILNLLYPIYEGGL
jgi:hypothetical protein